MHLVSGICWAHIQVLLIFIASMLQIVTDNRDGKVQIKISTRMPIMKIWMAMMTKTFSLCTVPGWRHHSRVGNSGWSSSFCKADHLRPGIRILYVDGEKFYMIEHGMETAAMVSKGFLERGMIIFWKIWHIAHCTECPSKWWGGGWGAIWQCQEFEILMMMTKLKPCIQSR